MPASHRELVVWQKAMELVVQVYGLTSGFPPAERFGLTSQLRARLFPCRRKSRKGVVARGSVTEVEALLTPAVRLSFASREIAAPPSSLVREISRMLLTLRRRLAPPVRP